MVISNYLALIFSLGFAKSFRTIFLKKKYVGLLLACIFPLTARNIGILRTQSNIYDGAF